jgi:hypothetical protein
VRYMNRAGREGNFRPSHLLNGLFDGYLYNAGFLDTSMPFEELRERSRITEVAMAAANVADFFQRIRQELPALPARRATTSSNEPPPAATDTAGDASEDAVSTSLDPAH